MANLSFAYDTGTVPITRIIDAICGQHNYTGFLPDGVTTITKANFACEQVRQHIIQEVRDYEREQARMSANAAVTDVTLS